jgi:hypothetical protein
MIIINGWSPGTQGPCDTPEPRCDRDAQCFHEATQSFDPCGGPAPRREQPSFTSPYLRPSYPQSESPSSPYLRSPRYLPLPAYGQPTYCNPTYGTPVQPGGNERALYQKVSQEVNAGTDQQTLERDAGLLAIAAHANSDMGLERIARNIGNDFSNDTYDQAGTSAALATAAPGSTGAAQKPDGAGANANALGVAFVQMEKDVDAPRFDRNTPIADADLLKNLAAKNGEEGLADVANNIKKSLLDGSYKPFDSLEALMQHPARPSDLSGSTDSAGTDEDSMLAAMMKSGLKQRT